jgi:pimeloyl-ACP methyl ester carboxylesterase
MLTAIAAEHEVFAPVALGMNIFDHQPSTIEDYLDMTLEFTEKMKLGPYHISGHSMGGAIAIMAASKSKKIETLSTICPAIPFDYGVFGFAIRSAIIGFREFMHYEHDAEIPTLSFGLDAMVKIIANDLKNPMAATREIRHLGSINYNDVEVSQKALVLLAENDEYFRYGPKEIATIERIMPTSEIQVVPNARHDWPLLYPSKATEKILEFIDIN